MKNPKATVITPSYNKSQAVGDAIESVLNQTYTNFEYIIVENSTNPETKKVVKKFKDKRIRYIDLKFTPQKRQEFYVPAHICNKFYPEARGEYIFFLSDDDIIFPNCFEAMVGFLDANREVNVCFHDQVICYFLNGKISFEPLVRGSLKILERGKTANPRDALDGGQIMFRKKILKDIAYPYFPQDWRTADICDKIFMEKLWNLYPFYPVKEILSIHRVVGSTTHRIRNPLKYVFYQGITSFLPESAQVFLGRMSGKRRAMSSLEKTWFEKIKVETKESLMRTMSSSKTALD